MGYKQQLKTSSDDLARTIRTTGYYAKHHGSRRKTYSQVTN